MKPYAFGVDIGGTTVKIGFFSSDGKFIEHWEIPTRTEDNGKNVLPDIAKAIKKKLKEHDLTVDDIEGVGPTRRKALMKHFQSLENIRNASVEELAEIDGINKKTAEAVYLFFRK